MGQHITIIIIIICLELLLGYFTTNLACQNVLKVFGFVHYLQL